MKIGIDARLLHNETGIGRYTRSLFFEFAHRPPTRETSYCLFTDSVETTPLSLPSNFTIKTIPCTTRILWTNLYLPGALRQQQTDVYHGVCNFELPVRKVCRYVVTIHDLVPLFFPHSVPWKHRLFFHLFMKRAAHTADKIITDSEHSKADIVRHLGVSAEKIRVIYLGYTPRQLDVQDVTKQQAVFKRYHLSQPYLLFVGVIEPKKNLTRVVTAFAQLKQMPGINPALTFVIAGGKGWFYDNLERTVRDLHLEQQVLFPGFIAEEDLPYMYAGAEAFVFPSIYEGFGLPVIEAMSYGVPVVTSNVSSLPEIAGNAGILVSPERPEAIRDGLAEVLLAPQKKEQMRQAGRRQAQRFSWTHTADETFQVYQDVYQKPSHQMDGLKAKAG